ncbi:MAG: DUF4864 domain-containing protein [Litoreibacter sp.]
MKAILISFMLAVAMPALAQERIAEIEATIKSQLNAFHADDFDTAFTYASPNIKRLFGSPDRFGMMVKNGYPMVHRSVDLEFIEIRRQGSFLFQKVKITDANGIPYFMEYNMIETSAGWQIDGVQLLTEPQVGT